MGNHDILTFAKMMIMKNQNRIPNTPWKDAAINAIMNGDANAGMQLANNLCNSNGVSVQDAVNQATRFFTS